MSAIPKRVIHLDPTHIIHNISMRQSEEVRISLTIRHKVNPLTIMHESKTAYNVMIDSKCRVLPSVDELLPHLQPLPTLEWECL